MAKVKDSKGSGVGSVGIVLVKKANSWLFYVHHNNTTSSINEWFPTQEKAQARLDKYRLEGK